MKRSIFLIFVLFITYSVFAEKVSNQTDLINSIDAYMNELGVLQEDPEVIYSIFDEASVGTNAPIEKANLGLKWRGFLRGSLFGGGKDYDLANAFAEIALQPQFNWNNLLFKSDLRFREGMFFNDQRTTLEVKELFAGYSSEKFDFLLGNQIVAWGRGDGFNPTNNITPTDFFYLTADPDDQRMSNFMMRMKYRFVPSVELDLIAIPFYKASNYRYDLFDLQPNIDFEGLPPGLLPDIQVDVAFEDIFLPERSLKNANVGARINFELPTWSFSFSYFAGYDPFHGFNLESLSFDMMNPQEPAKISYQPMPYLKQTPGFDFAIPMSSWIVKGEAAYNWIKNDKKQMFIPNSDFSYVLGFERIWKDFTFIGQYVGKAVMDFEDLVKPQLSNDFNMTELPQFAHAKAVYESALFNRKIFNQQAKMNHALALTVLGDFAYETLQAELTTYYNLTSSELLLRPKLMYKINDALSLTAGANYMHGADESVFGYSKRVLNGGFLELRIQF